MPFRKVLILLLVPNLSHSVHWLHENMKPSPWQFQSVSCFYRILQKCLYVFMSTAAVFTDVCVCFIFTGVFCIPLYIPYALTGTWHLGRGLCKTWLVMDYLLCSASVFNIVLISYDRFLSVTKAVRRAFLIIDLYILRFLLSSESSQLTLEAK